MRGIELSTNSIVLGSQISHLPCLSAEKREDNNAIHVSACCDLTHSVLVSCLPNECFGISLSVCQQVSLPFSAFSLYPSLFAALSMSLSMFPSLAPSPPVLSLSPLLLCVLFFSSRPRSHGIIQCICDHRGSNNGVCFFGMLLMRTLT